MDQHSEDKITVYELFMVALCFFVLVALGAQSFFQLDQDTEEILHYADTGICVVFIVDFFVNLFRKGWRYLKWGWIDLLSSIPMVGYLRVGRTVRIVRILRVLRGIRSVKRIASFILMHRKSGVAAAAAFVSILVIVFGSIGMLECEKGSDGSNIKDAGDALWWSIATVTTVGYGDKYPVTSEGRVLAAVLMTAGVGLFGTFTGLVASWFLSPGGKRQESDIEVIRRELAEVKALLQDMSVNRRETVNVEKK